MRLLKSINQSVLNKVLIAFSAVLLLAFIVTNIFGGVVLAKYIDVSKDLQEAVALDAAEDVFFDVAVGCVEVCVANAVVSNGNYTVSDSFGCRYNCGLTE